MSSKENKIWLSVGIIWSLALFVLLAAGMRFLFRSPKLLMLPIAIIMIGLLSISIILSRRPLDERQPHYAPFYKIGDTSIDLTLKTAPVIKSFIHITFSLAAGLIAFLMGLAGHRLRK